MASMTRRASSFRDAPSSVTTRHVPGRAPPRGRPIAKRGRTSTNADDLDRRGRREADEAGALVLEWTTRLVAA
jgi:hypothetical protein